LPPNPERNCGKKKALKLYRRAGAARFSRGDLATPACGSARNLSILVLRRSIE
jgi:hypothetical protein